MVASADGRRAVVYAEDPASAGILLCREPVLKEILILMARGLR